MSIRIYDYMKGEVAMARKRKCLRYVLWVLQENVGSCLYSSEYRLVAFHSFLPSSNLPLLPLGELAGWLSKAYLLFVQEIVQLYKIAPGRCNAGWSFVLGIHL